jgi:large subunit ribosomal protein L16|uniref:Ribosomal protein L16 n=1 Tax=Trieres regia TaxID=1335017 RepID=A0A7T4WR38_9STRA|nr:ribosomal protein L16 [Odontella regia]QQD79320.1 ribosomal protein L16 [Odontella regia]
MFLQPKKTKYRKSQKGSKFNLEFRSAKLRKGVIGLKSAEPGIITARQLEAARKVISRKTNREGKMWIRIFPKTPISKKPVEVRMGKGKGSITHWGAKVKRGTVMFELCGLPLRTAIVALNAGGTKLPIKSVIFS